jgi:Putative peptidoglycan binding domain
MSTHILTPGGAFGGAEAPVRRAMEIGLAQGLKITSTKRTSGDSTSDHHVSQTRSFACDLSNGDRPTPEMDATAKALATALGHPEFRSGLLIVTRGSVRAQLIWRSDVGGNHFNHVHFGVRVTGDATVPTPAHSGLPRLTIPNKRGSRIRRIQRRLNALGFGPLEVDAIFGAQTDAAVRRFQQARGLEVDGIVGPLTLAALG